MFYIVMFGDTYSNFFLFTPKPAYIVLSHNHVSRKNTQPKFLSLTYDDDDTTNFMYDKSELILKFRATI